MTDLATPAIDEDFVSSAETRPVAGAPATATATCHFCPQSFEGPARWFTRGHHEKDKHREAWTAKKAGAPTSKARAKSPRAAAKPKDPAVAGSKLPARRIPAAATIARNISRAAKLISQADPVMSRAITFAAPATGGALDELVAGTMIDRKVVQRFAAGADKWERLGGVVSFPILVAVVSRNQALFPLLEEELRDATLEVVIASIPTLEKQHAREKKAVDALRRLGQVDERYANTDDPIGLILRDIFMPIMVPDGPSE